MERRIVLVLRLAAALLVLIGLVSLAAPGRTLGHDCGSPVAPRPPSAAQAWRDVYELQGDVAHCPSALRMRRGIGAVALLGALVTVAVPAFVAGGRPGGGVSGAQRLVLLRALAVGLLLLAVGAATVSAHDRVTLCGSPIAPEDHHDHGCSLRFGARWVVAGVAGVGAVGAGGAAVVAARRRRDEEG